MVRIAHVAVLLASMLASGAWALVPVVTTYNYPGSTEKFGSVEAACIAWMAKAAPANYQFYYAQGASCFELVDGHYGGRWGDVIGTSMCPSNSTPVSGGCSCNSRSGYQEDATRTSCIPASPQPSNMCKIPEGLFQGQPIFPATAEKYRSETDWSDSGAGALSITRTYRSNWASDASRVSNPLGQVWAHNFNVKLVATPATAPLGVTITSDEGYVRTFSKPAGATTWAANNSADTLAQLASGTWSYSRAEDNATLNFDSSGQLQTETDRNGWVTSHAYNGAGQLASVTNHFGRTLVFGYNGLGQLSTVTTPDARVIAYAYDSAGRLASVLYPDGKGRNFVYENASFPQALTGIFDEAGVRWGTFAYDSTGRAVSTQLAGSVDSYQVSLLISIQK